MKSSTHSRTKNIFREDVSFGHVFKSRLGKLLFIHLYTYTIGANNTYVHILWAYYYIVFNESFNSLETFVFTRLFLIVPSSTHTKLLCVNFADWNCFTWISFIHSILKYYICHVWISNTFYIYFEDDICFLLNKHIYYDLLECVLTLFYMCEKDLHFGVCWILYPSKMKKGKWFFFWHHTRTSRTRRWPKCLQLKTSIVVSPFFHSYNHH